MSEAQSFSYGRGIAPMMWVFVALASIELLVVHFLLWFWVPTVAMVLSALTIASIIWIVLLIRSFARLPVRLDCERLIMRVGSLRSVELPIDQVAGLRSDFTAETLKERGVLNLALIAWPNIFVELDPPVKQGRRQIRAVAHKLDDSAAFTAALERLLRERVSG